MDFDASSAEPMGAVAEPKFDPATAQSVPEFDPSSAEPVKADASQEGLNRFRIDPEKFQAMGTLDRLKTIVSHPWDKYVASVDEGFKGPLEIPRVEADKGNTPVEMAGQVGAAIDNTVSGVVSGAVSPGGIVAVTNPLTMVYSAPRFIAGGVEHIIDAYKSASGSGNLQDFTEKSLGGALMVVGGVHGGVTGLKSGAPPATPEVAVRVLKEEAAQTENPQARAALEAAAEVVTQKAQSGVFDAASAAPVTPTLADQPVTVSVKRANGSTVAVEMPAAKAEAAIKKNLDDLNAELESVYQQAGVERNPPPAKLPAPEPFDAASAEPFVAQTAEAVKSAPEYPTIKDNVSDGRVVRSDVPNTSSISATLTDYETLPGIRDVPMSDFTLTGKHYSVEGQKRIDSLAEQIKASGEINPLIVVQDAEGSYILEGATRADALKVLGAKSFPALVVKDLQSIAESSAKKTSSPEPVVQFTIQRPQPRPSDGAEIPGYVQVETRTNQGRGEPLTPEQKAKYPTEEQAMATDLPTGQYTLDEVQSAITSTKNAQVERERAARGIAAADQAVVRDFPEVRDQAEAIIKDDAQAGERLVMELKDNPRPLTDVENAVLLHRQVQLQNEFRDTPLTDRATIDRLSDELADIYTAGQGAGTETGRGLNARKMAVAEDFSLANLVTLRRAVKGTRLSEAELAETAALHEKISSLQNEYDAYRRRASELLMQDEAPAAKHTRIVQVLSDRADAARERIKARLQSGQVSAGIDPALLKDMAEVGAYHLARGIEKAAEWSAEMVKEFGEKITPHLATLREQSEALRTQAVAEKSDAGRLASYKTRTLNKAKELENRTATGNFENPPRRAIVKDEEARQLQARLESAKAEFTAALERDRYEKLSVIGKAREQGLNTYDAARNLMTTGEFSFILRQGKFTALSHPILTAKALPDTFAALLSNEVGARAIDLKTMNQPEAAAARAAKLHLVEEGAKLSRQEEIFASKWAERIPGLRNFNQAGRVFLNKVRFDVWKNLREQLPEITPERDAQLAKFVNEATGRGTLGALEVAAVPLGRLMFSPRFLASRIQLAVGHSLWGGDLATRRVIAKEYAKALVALGIYYTLLSQMKDKNGQAATIEKDPRSSDFGKVKVGNTRLDPLAGLSQVIVFGARTASLERKDAKGRVQSLNAPKFAAQKWSDVATNFARSKLHPVPGAIVNLFNGTDLGGQPATVPNQSINFVTPLTYVDIYQAMQEQDLPEGVSLSLLALLGEGMQTYDSNRKRPKPSPTKN